LAFWSVLIFLVLIAGLMATFLPYWLIVAIVIAPIFPVIAWVRPEYAIVAILAVGSGLIKSHFLPTIPVLGGSMSPADLALLALVPIALLKSYGRWTELLRNMKHLAWPLALFLALAVLSMINAGMSFGTPAKEILGEGRHLLHWLLLPLVVLVLRDEQSLRRLITGLWVVAILFALGQVVQSFFGVSVFGQGVVGAVKTVDQEYGGIHRSQSGGITFVILALYLLVTSRLLGKRGRFWFLPLSALFGIAILVSFGRGIWLTTFIGLAVIGLVAGIGHFGRLIGILAMMVAMAVAAIGLYEPQSIGALQDRVLSAGDDVAYGSSLNWRFYENRVAVDKIQEHPILGIGLGTAYRPAAASDVFSEQARYIHNGYLYLVLKMGPISLVLIAALLLSHLRMARQLLRANLPFDYRAMTIASLALIAQLMILSLTQPEFLMMSWGIGLIAVLIGVACATAGLREAAKPATPESS
jgi:O-antigen ligase